MRIPNPIDKRLDFVRKQYGQEAYEKTREIVARNLGIAEADIAPGMRVDWEKFIPWLGKQVHKLLKKQKAGLRVQGEFDRLERGFLASVEPFLVKKKGRKADIARLSPKRARQFAGRQQRVVGEARDKQAKKLGYKEVARLGNGYTAVVAVIDPKAPEFWKYTSDLPGPRVGVAAPEEFRPREKEWVTTYAPFQQWLGVELENCLQFYEVNYTPHGATAFEVQRAGGKLYGILNPKGKPVAAISTEPDGSIRETNGPGNRPPPEKDQEYVDRFVQKHLKQDVKDTAFHPPEEFPSQISGIIEYLLDAWDPDDHRSRRKFLRKIQGYSRQQGADFSKIWPQLAVYILEESPYSALSSVKKVDYQRKQESASIIKRVADLYRRNGTQRELTNAAEVARGVHRRRRDDISNWRKEALPGLEPPSIKEMRTVALGALAAEQAAKVARGSAAASAMVTVESAAEAANAPGDTWDDIERGEEAGADFTKKLLELMRDAARAAGGAQPRRGNPTGARALVKECQRLWEHYCERPNKTRLKAVVKHCEAMKASKATTVKSERSRCLRSARAEDRKHGYGIS